MLNIFHLVLYISHHFTLGNVHVNCFLSKLKSINRNREGYYSRKR